MKYLSIIFFFVTISLFGQTVWSDSGSVYTGLETKEISFTGIVSDGDTLVSLPFDLSGYHNIYSLWGEMSQSNDSINVRVIRESSGLAGVWLDTKIITSENSSNPDLYADTLNNIASVRRLKFVGISGNGYLTNFKLKIIASKN